MRNVIGVVLVLMSLGACAPKRQLHVYVENTNRDEAPLYFALYGFERAPAPIRSQPCGLFTTELLPDAINAGVPLTPLSVVPGVPWAELYLDQVGWDPKHRWLLAVPLYDTKCELGSSGDAWALVRVGPFQRRIHLAVRDHEFLVPNNLGGAVSVDRYRNTRWREHGCVDGDRRRVTWAWCGPR